MSGLAPYEYDDERIAEFGDEGGLITHDGEPFCVECGCDEPVTRDGETCPLCVSDANDRAAIQLLRNRALSVEVKCALTVMDRAIRHLAQGRWHTPQVVSLVIQELTTEAA